ncbi:MAG: universal stress protein [Betaproteobacteria bacterium]|nr:universal stress protein [Betaproteobacteria bacterium]
MYRILVAVDGSEHSLRAVEYAAQRAKNASCRIDLLHVEKPVMAWEIGPVSPIEPVAAAREAESRELLDAGAGRFDHATEIEKHAVRGEPARTIIELADKLGVDEIVIGSHGRRPLGAALLGSVTYEVLHDAHVAVVVIR